MRKLLLIGTNPPPLGGVTIFVKRLCDHLEMKDDIDLKFIDYRRTSLVKIIKEIYKTDVAHLNCSSPIFRFLIVILARIFLKKIINTIHGSLGRFNSVLNLFDYTAVLLSTIPTVLNDNSLIKSLKINKKSIKISSFLPVLNEKEDQRINEIMNYKSEDFIFCTNASRVSFDISQNEIYGITHLIKLFRTLPLNYKLVISTPSEEYVKYLETEKIKLSENIKIIAFDHMFINVIKKSDVMIRATSTDGDAISVKEALYYGKDVFCTDVVSRPEGTNLFHYFDDEQLKKMILSYEKNNKESTFIIENSLQKLIEIYKTI